MTPVLSLVGATASELALPVACYIEFHIQLVAF